MTLTFQAGGDPDKVKWRRRRRSRQSAIPRYGGAVETASDKIHQEYFTEIYLHMVPGTALKAM
jgi:hypothetical protein